MVDFLFSPCEEASTDALFDAREDNLRKRMARMESSEQEQYPPRSARGACTKGCRMEPTSLEARPTIWSGSCSNRLAVPMPIRKS